jgi:hypothetical protein
MATEVGASTLERAWNWWVKARLLRWGFVGALVLVGLGLSLFGGFVVCRDELATVGNSAVVRSCGPPGLTDLPVVAGVFLLVVLLAPDLSEVSIGVLSLKQRVEDTRRDQKEIRAEFEGLKQSFNISPSATAEQTTSVATSIEALDLPGTIREIVRGISRNPDLAGAEDHAGGVDPRFARTLGELVLTISRLEFLLGSTVEGRLSGIKIRFWFVEVELGSEKLQSYQSQAFADLTHLIEDKGPIALRDTRDSFKKEYLPLLGRLGVVREFAINGVISLDDAESALQNLRILLGALSIRLEQLPRSERAAAAPKKGLTATP